VKAFRLIQTTDVPSCNNNTRCLRLSVSFSLFLWWKLF